MVRPAVLVGGGLVVLVLLAAGALLEMATRHVLAGRVVFGVGAGLLGVELWRWGTTRVAGR